MMSRPSIWLLRLASTKWCHGRRTDPLPSGRSAVQTRSGIRYWMPPPSSRGAPLSRNWRRARPARACVHGDVVIVLHQDATDTWSGVEEKVAQLVERTLQDGRPRTVSVVVGPEGGISEQEVADFVKAGAVSCVLGRNILRAAPAGPVALSLLSRVLGRYE